MLVAVAAGLLARNFSQQLLGRGDQVRGYDHVNNYCGVSLTRARRVGLLFPAASDFCGAALENRAAPKFASANFDPHRSTTLPRMDHSEVVATYPLVRFRTETMCIDC